MPRVVNTKSPDEMFYATMLHQSPFMKKGLVYTGNNFKYATWEECCSGYVLSRACFDDPVPFFPKAILAYSEFAICQSSTSSITCGQRR